VNKRAAFAKVRAKIRREAAEVEESEHEGGEINLIPYLDIVTNTVIFMLATTASAVVLANISVSAPRYTDPTTAAIQADPNQEPKERLNLTIAISNKGFIVAGAGGVMKAPDGSLPTIPCAQALKAGRCPAFITKRHNAKLGIDEKVWVDHYDRKALITLLTKVKKRFPNERQVILSADRNIPYQVVVHSMDTIRGKRTAKCTGDDGCLFDQVVLSAGVQ